MRIKFYLCRLLLILVLFVLFRATGQAQAPVANFTATSTAGCSPLVVNLQDLSTGNPTSWSWDFGNGGTSVLQNPTAAYFVPGTYTVRLTVTNATGSNTLTRTQYITVYEPPTVDFSVPSTIGCFPLRVQFTDLSTAGVGNTNVSWLWDFGNGTQSTLQNPFVTYLNAGTYTVILRVTNDKGCTKVLSRANYIQVTNGVRADFTNTQPVVCQPPANISFTNNSTGPPVLSYLWDFGDGNTSTQQNPVHTYAGAGTYDISLVTTSSAGCFETIRKPAIITIGGISTAFTAVDNICVNIPVSFQNTSSPPPAAYNWDFGDGTTSTALNPVKTYTTPGLYTIKLINTYSTCRDSALKNILIYAQPAADFTAPVTINCQPPLTVNFQDASTGNAISWLWDFGDGNTSALQNPVHTYTNYGSYNVSLVVTNAAGCMDSVRKNQFIRIARPVISIPSLPAHGCIPFTINPVANITLLDAVTSYLWDFGDGNTSTSATPSHTYPTQGTYAVTLTITTSTGCTESVINTVTIGSKPTAAFSGVPLPVCAFQPVTFTDLSTPMADQWFWDFGDGSTSNLQNPQHIYSDTGHFTVSLMVTNNGCPDTHIKPNYIQVLPPIARFGFATNCLNKIQFTFTDSSIGPVAWSWDFGDGFTSTLQSPVHSFPGLGVYNVKLTVTNGTCSHSITKVIKIVDEVPNFTVSPLTSCRPTPTTFTAQNVNPDNVIDYTWLFGNGSQTGGSTPNVTVTYPASGTYSPSLVVTDINGCHDTITKSNYIRINGPTANFSVTNTGGCKGLIPVFTDLSTNDGIHNIVTWKWDFGDGTIQNYTSPPFQHTYNTPGTFSVKLIVTDATGCVDSLTIPDLINATNPHADFLSPDSLSCPGATVQFINSSTAINFTSLWNFGDGNTSITTFPTNVYTTSGLYTIKLRIRDQYGCEDSITRNQYIRVDKPVAAFIINDSITSCVPFEVTFTNKSTYYSSLQWFFGNGGNSTLTNPINYYGAPGTYIAKLYATSPGGCIDSAQKTIRVYDTAGSKITYLPLNGCIPVSVSFSAFTSGPVRYLWDFGDGSIVDTTSPNVNHLYSSFGDFIPKVILTDPSGCIIPLSGIDTIHMIGAYPKFGNNLNLLCDSGYIKFSDSTSFNDPIVNYNWNFGDGNSSTLQNPVHAYSSPGLYSVSLNVQTQKGCTYSTQKPNLINVDQSPLITIGGDSSVCVFSSLLSTGVFQRFDTAVVKWVWTFPNGNSSTLQNPLPQIYTVPGNYTITGIATNNGSKCADTAIKNIIVHPLPIVTMPGTLTMQAGVPVIIPAVYSSNVTSYVWSPSTGLSCTNCPQPLAGPKLNTKYVVAFTDSNSCRNTGTISIIVYCKDGNVFVPNTFSPNKDGSNDIFYPRGKGIDRIKKLRIFNRWGEIVFERGDFQVNDPLSGWDGTFKGRTQQAGVYIYQIEMYCDNGDLIKFEGNVALIL